MYDINFQRGIIGAYSDDAWFLMGFIWVSHAFHIDSF